MKFDIIYDNLPFIMDATLITIKITVLAFIFAVIIAVTVGTLRSIELPKPVAALLSAYVEVFRGTPLLVQLFFIYYGMPFVGIVMSSYTAAILGLALNSGAYISEIIRAALLSVEKGQEEAASSLGLSKVQCFLYVIFPQAFRIALPPLVNSFSGLLKDSSLVSVLSITELTRIGQLIYTRTSRPFEIYLTLGVLYFAITYTVSIISKKIEKRINIMY